MYLSSILRMDCWTKARDGGWNPELGQKVVLVYGMPQNQPLSHYPTADSIMRSTLLTGVLWLFPAGIYKEHQPLSNWPTAEVVREEYRWLDFSVFSTALQVAAHVTSALRSLGLQCSFQNVSTALSRQNFSTIPELSQEVNRCRGVCTQCHLRVHVCVWEREVGWGMLVFSLCILCVFDVTCFACLWNMHTQERAL